MQIVDQNLDAFQLTVEDPTVRAYLQRHPFAVGPDRTMNARCGDIFQNQLTIRNRTHPVETIMLKPHETLLTPKQMDRLDRLMNEAGISTSARAGLVDDYAWETSLVPLDTKDVLVIGCADGPELMFLRAVLPEANITALDYEDMIPPALSRAIGVRFFQGDLHELLARFGQEFDLISSNHTIEHLYTPDEILATLSGLLRDRGVLISTLPMDGMAGTPFLKRVRDVAITKRVHPLDYVYLDAGHPWKTNPADMSATLQEVGFEPPVFYQREQHLSREAAYGEARFNAGLAIGKILHTIFFGLPRSFAKVAFPKRAPNVISKVLLAAERRIWFGTNRLKNKYTQEVLVLARKASE
ncbi:class I SAM-dependent methyltransferase [Edaphobacter bradus]|uniref:class I SAM-dependent methyltransferase n=1 Tax=Edaphobacter bradus TaxID=2259016 RepID=UPI0021DFE221|nr:class I SAM-dependent methyltransferase [Edaphobacter bradus]